MSATGIWVMCAVILAALAIWLGIVLAVSRVPYFKRPRQGPVHGGVQGGTHTGGGRSVAPVRDEPVTLEGEAERARRASGNPMNL